MSDYEIEIEPIEKDLMQHKVAEAILSYIYRNGLKPGNKLPSERQLAVEFAVGRNSVRQGLCQLEEEDIIERMVGKGAFVKKEVSADSIQLKLMKVNYKDLLEIKINLEQLAIRRAAEIATPEQIAGLKKIALELCALADKGIFSVELDRTFHIALLECGGSHTLSQLVITMIDSLDYYTNMFGNVSEIWVKTISYHLDIVNALEKKQVNLALAAHEYIYQQDIKVLDRLESNNTTNT